MIDGRILYNDTLSLLAESKKQKPSSLEGKLILGAIQPHKPMPWFQSRVRLTNVQVYSSQLGTEELKLLTTSHVCQGEGDYLSWKDMSWTFHGAVVNGEVTLHQFCQPELELRYVMSAHFNSWTDCMEFCPKIRRYCT